MLLHELFERCAARTPQKVALVTDGERYTYADIHGLAATLAVALQNQGVRRGDRVATLLENGVAAVAGIFGALKCGAVLMPVNPLTKATKLAYLLNDSRARAIVAQASLHGEYGPALAQNDSVQVCLVTGAGAAGAGIDSRCRPFPGANGSATEAFPEPLAVPVIDQDLAAILYTSGSTGEAKGVMLTHANMVAAARSVGEYLQLRSSDVILCALPLAFDYGLYQVLMGFSVGATVVLERSFAFPGAVMASMARESVTVFPGVPTMFSVLLNMPSFDARRLTTLRAITNTAAALSEAHIRQLRALFPAARLYSMYGLTECKRVSYLPPEQLDLRPTSVGRGMPNEEVWLVGESGERLPNGSTGELVVRGSNVMLGYWEKPEDTAARLKPGPLPGQPVLYTGDIFRTDAEGYLYFVGRKDDIIKSGGEKVSPREVENVLYGMPGVLEAAVIGVADPLLGEAVKAFVVLAPGSAPTERDVIKYCLRRLESFMAPKQVEFVDQLPQTDTGKIRKAGLR